jgi:RNA binding exosome subunit
MIYATKMQLSNASVTEALSDWLNKHMSVEVKINSWSPGYGENASVIDITFEQVRSKPKIVEAPIDKLDSIPVEVELEPMHSAEDV